MLTITIWKNLIKYIKDIKEYLWDEDKMLATIEIIILPIFTPFILLLDICAMPLELLYLIVYKFLWGGKE